MYSSYVGTAKATNEKVSIKQFMVQRYDPKTIVQEVANLSRLSHEAFPKVLELFHTDTSVYMVRQTNTSQQTMLLNLTPIISPLCLGYVLRRHLSLEECCGYQKPHHQLVSS